MGQAGHWLDQTTYLVSSFLYVKKIFLLKLFRPVLFSKFTKKVSWNLETPLKLLDIFSNIPSLTLKCDEDDDNGVWDDDKLH